MADRIFFTLITVEDDGTENMQSRLEETVRNAAITEFGYREVHLVTTGELAT